MATWKSGKNTLPPVWVDKIEAVEEETQKIGVMMRELQSLHNKRLTVSFDMNEDDSSFSSIARFNRLVIVLNRGLKDEAI